MAKKNFTITTVATAPSPATSGTSLVVAAGTGSLFAVNEPAIIFPVNDQPLVSNAEIVMVTNVATDTLTITRTQESTSARTIVAGDIIIQGITAKDWNDLITLVSGKITAFADPNADRIVFWDDSAGAFAALTASTGLTISGTNMTVRTSSATQTGIVELATTAETETGTDATRAVTPDALHDMTTLAGAAWMLDEDNMASDSATKVASQQSIKAYADTKIPNSIKSGNGDSVATVDSADIAGEYLVKFDADGNITDSGLHSGNVLESIDEDNMSSNLDTKVPTQQSVKAYVDTVAPSSGWISAGETWTYGSADDPTYTFTISGDKTSKYSVGMKIKLTQTTTKYFIITAISYSSPNTTVTVYGGTDYDLANATITSPYYSMVKSPFGFPMSPAKWTVTSSGGSSQSAPTKGTYYNIGGNIVVPIGLWKLGYDFMGYADAATTQFMSVSPSFGTTTSNADIAGSNTWSFQNNSIMIVNLYNEIIYSATSKTTLYLNACTNYNSVLSIQYWNYPPRKWAVCAYL